MSIKHGIYVAERQEDIYELYWMGERVKDSDFNERMVAQARSIAKDVDMIQLGADMVEGLNEGQKTVAQLNTLEKVLKLPLCVPCRALIGDVGKSE